MRRRAAILICVSLCVAVAICYGRTLGFEFVNYDDHRYITGNPIVLGGLTQSGIAWAFTTFDVANWHPLTWLSHMLDVQIFGVDHPGGHHFTNVLLHLANTSLLLAILYRMTGALWRSALVAALFAVHPLHVESVAWVSERKDVLSTLFGLLAIWQYIEYVSRRDIARFLLVIAFFSLSLMAKPTLVTLPFALLLLDYWPLRRFSAAQHERAILTVIGEKLPLLMLSIASCWITIQAQQSGEAIHGLESLPIGARLANAAISYFIYLRQTIWPVDLGPLYPLQTTWPVWQIVGAVAMLAVITLFAVVQRRKRPHLLVGWLWFLGTLVPMIGLVQVGSQAHADRYMYIPSIGLFIMASWCVLGTTHVKPVTAIAAVAIALLTVQTWLQVGYWRNSVVLSERAIAVTYRNGIAHFNLANAYVERSQFDDAVREFRTAAEIMPRWTAIHFNLGNTLMRQDKLDEAIDAYQRALDIQPDFGDALINRGVALARQQRFAEAAQSFAHAVQIEPYNIEWRSMLAKALADGGQIDDAIAQLKIAEDLARSAGESDLANRIAQRIVDLQRAKNSAP